jgi:hypothetical protein
VPPLVARLGHPPKRSLAGVWIGQREELPHRRVLHDRVDAVGVAGLPRAQQQPLAGQFQIVQFDALELPHADQLARGADCVPGPRADGFPERIGPTSDRPVPLPAWF